MTFDVDLIDTREPWSEALVAMGRHDFFHTFDFHKASQSIGEGRPVAFVARQHDEVVGFWPLLERGIPDSDLHDYGSVYGYGGPLLGPVTEPSVVLSAMKAAMRREAAVSLFSRMHPLFVGHLPSESARGARLGDVVVIEVNRGDCPPASYRGSHRREITRLSEAGVTVEIEDGPEALEIFQSIYEMQMSALGAKSYYYFDRAYYKAMLNASDFKTYIFIARMNGEVAAAAMFVLTGEIMQYFLSGTVEKFRKAAPAKLLISRAHALAIERGVEHLVLGGGVGSSRDALFKFKEGFSKALYPFHVVREVLDEDAYIALCRNRQINPDEVQFFPAYRA